MMNSGSLSYNPYGPSDYSWGGQYADSLQDYKRQQAIYQRRAETQQMLRQMNSTADEKTLQQQQKPPSSSPEMKARRKRRIADEIVKLHESAQEGDYSEVRKICNRMSTGKLRAIVMMASSYTIPARVIGIGSNGELPTTASEKSKAKKKMTEHCCI